MFSYNAKNPTIEAGEKCLQSKLPISVFHRFLAEGARKTLSAFSQSFGEINFSSSSNSFLNFREQSMAQQEFKQIFLLQRLIIQRNVKT